MSERPLEIASFEVLTIEIPMRFSVEHSLAARSTARNVLLCARADDGDAGFGESCPREYVTGETIDSVRDELRRGLLPALLGRRFASMDEVVAHLEAMLDGLRREQQAAFCAMELAVLDLAGRRFGVSAGSVLGPIERQVARYSGVIASEKLDGLVKMATFMAQFGVGAVKVKTGADLDHNRRLLDTARSILGDGVQLRIDANAAWTAEDALEQLDALRPYRLAGVEQPVDPSDIDAMAAVTAAAITPVVADESLCSIDDALRLIERSACDVFNLRVSKCGGLINTGRLHRLAQQAGLSCQLGAQVGETGILSAAGRHVATRLRGLRWREGSYGKILLETDITDPDVTVGPGGRAPALDAPGLGVVPVPEVVAAHTVDSFEL